MESLDLDSLACVSNIKILLNNYFFSRFFYSMGRVGLHWHHLLDVYLRQHKQRPNRHQADSVFRRRLRRCGTYIQCFYHEAGASIPYLWHIIGNRRWIRVLTISSHSWTLLQKAYGHCERYCCLWEFHVHNHSVNCSAYYSGIARH